MLLSCLANNIRIQKSFYSKPDKERSEASCVQYNMPRKKDITWSHCKEVEGNHNAVICNYCGKQYMGGGITRFKKHLAGGNPNVETCTKCGKEVRDLFRKIADKMVEKKMQKQLLKKSSTMSSYTSQGRQKMNLMMKKPVICDELCRTRCIQLWIIQLYAFKVFSTVNLTQKPIGTNSNHIH
ncbi:hypothetical protein AQUCO_00500564v1 [Aquilegia coerulea]|uniref:BED-type domain-containing protein n=1 Tax=Aquilegia coerulea TaxID=218851 RepID=A0A2G5ESS9_AQUCA|nr:hypothetical protein AQUCO_00500564v1 [Aquilegia coerulea]